MPTWSLPTLCEVCRRWAADPVCADCDARFGAPAARCAGCGLRLATPAEASGAAPEIASTSAPALCGACRRAPLPFAHCCCAVDYAFPWDRLIAAFKYQGRPELGDALAQRLLAALPPGAAAWPALVLPVPLAPDRLAERGYDQAWELARRVARAIDRPTDATVLRRVSGRNPQAGLSRRARQRNLRGAFQVDAPARVAGRAVALVDDVLTTGATAIAAARALRDAGATAVALWTLARTP